MSTLSTDTFNRTNSSSSLGSTDGSGSKDPAAWTANVGTWGISSNQAYAPTAAAAAYATVDLATADVDLSLTIANVGGGNGAGLIFRMQSTGNYYVFDLEATIRLWRVTAGAFTSLYNSAGGANGDVLRVVAKGTFVRIYRNGTLLTTVTDTSYQTSTKHGLWVFANTTALFDSWSASTIGSPYTTDTFNRADNTSSQGSTDGSGSLDPLTWTTHAGTMGINSNRFYASAVVSSQGRAIVDTGSADMDVQATVVTTSAGAGIIFRVVDVSNYWLWRNISGVSRLYKVSAGVLTQVGSDQAGAADGDVLRAVANGSSITAYRNGTSLITTTDSTHLTGTGQGGHVADTTARLDSFSVSGPPVATTVTGAQATETDTGTSGSLSIVGTVYPAAGDRVLALKTATSDSWYGFLT